MIRRLLTMLSALSLVLCVAIAAVWVRSYFVSDSFTFVPRLAPAAYVYPLPEEDERSFCYQRSISAYLGTFEYSRLQQFSENADDAGYYHHRVEKTDDLSTSHAGLVVRERQWDGFYFVEVKPQPRYQGGVWLVRIPCWPPFLMLAVMPALWMFSTTRRWRIARWLSQGLCAGCGYDLRATPGRCPECAAVPRIKKPPT